MTTYKGIKGKSIQNVTADVSDSAEGQVWYNSTAGAFKSVVVGEAWSSGSNMGTARRSFASAGTQTATLGAGGYTGSNAGLTTTEEYNGSGWSSANNMNISMYANYGVGTQTAASSIGGSNFPGGYPRSAKVQNYDGTTWTTSPTDINSARGSAATGGTQTAAIIAGGFDPSVRVAKTEEYNGTTWSEVNDLNTGRASLYGVGNQTAMIAASGDTGPSINYSVESYDGTSWTAVATAPPTIDRDYGAAGSTTDALFYVDTSTFGFDGTTFSSKPSMVTAKNNVGSAGTQTSAIAFGGSTPPSGTSYLSATEEYNKSINVITGAAWASGGNLNTGRDNMLVFGTQNAAVGAAGYNYPPGHRAESEEYNGTSWTEGNNVNTARSSGAASGSLTAGIVYAGYTGSNTAATEEYDGTSYTEVNVLNTGRRLLAGSTNSPQSSATAFGGFVTAGSNLTEEYDGTNWTAGGTMSGARYKLGGAGTQTAALAFGGIPAPGGANQTATEEYDGSAWTSGGSLITAASQNSGTGTQTAALSFGGTPNVTTTVGYDGSAWSTRPALGTGRGYLKGCGTNTSALVTGGNNPAYSTGTEEFTGETSASNYVSVTTS
jgi:hypothetical protein